jgi:hypothetical protein
MMSSNLLDDRQVVASQDQVVVAGPDDRHVGRSRLGLRLRIFVSVRVHEVGVNNGEGLEACGVLQHELRLRALGGECVRRQVPPFGETIDPIAAASGR